MKTTSQVKNQKTAKNGNGVFHKSNTINSKGTKQTGMNGITQLSGIRDKLFMDRYSLKDENGKPREKYPELSWRRMSKAISRMEKTNELRTEWEMKFYNSMVDFKFVPAGRIWCSAGTKTKATMINCFVIPSPADTRVGIIKTLEYMTEISARGGGVGFNVSTLRPRGSYLRKVNGTTSGSVSWASLYSMAAHDIIQQGGTRRGALMIMLWDWHPDIEEFITVKKKQGKLLGANLSVCVSDKFMNAVNADKDWELKFPDTDHKKYRKEWNGDIRDWEQRGYPVRMFKKIKAKKLWDMICESAWESAEPGVVFMDRYNKMNNTWYFEKNIATNPCGEQGLPAWGVCNLSSINLSAFVSRKRFDYKTFKETIRVGVRFLDNVIDAENYIFKEIEKIQRRERRIGLGTMGLADALIKMEIRYGSSESLEVIEKIYKMLRDVSYETSISLAKEKGSFPMLSKTKYLQGGFIKTLPKTLKNKIKRNGIRNAFLVTEAPTGKISLLSGVSSGIEPVFSFSYKQKDRLGERTMYHPLYEKWVIENPDSKIPDYYVVADDLTPEEHVSIQALIQKYTDSSISKTVNAPKSHTKDEVKKLYKLAFETGCKGISYMREGSREGTLIRNKDGKEEIQKNSEIDEIEKRKVWERPIMIAGSTYKLKTPVGTAFITINRDESGIPIEVFVSVGRAGSDLQAMAEALGRLCSKMLKVNGSMTAKNRALMIIDQLNGIGGMRPVGFGKNRITSLPDAVAKALKMDMNLSDVQVPVAESEITRETVHQLKLSDTGDDGALLRRRGDICSACGNATLVYEMGCKTCHGCGYSEC